MDLLVVVGPEPPPARLQDRSRQVHRFETDESIESLVGSLRATDPPPHRRVGTPGRGRPCGRRTSPGRVADRALHRRVGPSGALAHADGGRRPSRQRSGTPHGRGRVPRRIDRPHPDGPAGPDGHRVGVHPGRQTRDVQSGRIVQGPHCALHDRRGRAGGPARSRWHHRRTDEWQYRCRTGHRRRPQGVQVHIRLSRQGGHRQDRPAARLRGRGHRLSDLGAARAPRFLLLGLGPPGPRGPECVEARPVPQPSKSAGPVRDGRAGNLGADAWPCHALRRRHRHRGHHHRHRPLPQRTQSRHSDHRRRPGGLRLFGRVRTPVPGRRDRRGLLAHDL